MGANDSLSLTGTKAIADGASHTILVAEIRARDGEPREGSRLELRPERDPAAAP